MCVCMMLCIRVSILYACVGGVMYIFSDLGLSFGLLCCWAVGIWPLPFKINSFDKKEKFLLLRRVDYIYSAQKKG